MTEDEKRAYAKYLIEDHAQDVVGLSVYEMYDEYREYPEPAVDLSDEDMRAVLDLVRSAKVEVSW